jgi:hypothetical protein
VSLAWKWLASVAFICDCHQLVVVFFLQANADENPMNCAFSNNGQVTYRGDHAAFLLTALC